MMRPDQPLFALVVGILLGVVSASAQQSVVPSEPSPLNLSNDAVIAQLLQVTLPELAIHPGDFISVRILEIDKYDYRVRVATNGSVNLPLIDAITVAGKSSEEATKRITERLEAQDMVHNPHVYVAIEEQPSQVITVAGEVMKSDVFPAPTVRTLWAAISKAGGLKDTASSQITLIRPSDGKSYSIQLGTSPATSPVGFIPLFAGDTIVVKKIGVIYVVGAVKLSGMYPLKNYGPTTVGQAMVLAGNAGYEADKKDALIVRRTPQATVEIHVDLRDLTRSSEHDPVMQDGDILLIPSNAMKAALKSGGANVAVSLATAALLRQ